MLLLIFTNIFIHTQQPNLHSKNIFIHIYLSISYSRLYLLTFTRCLHSHSSTSYIHSHSRSKYSVNIFCASPLRIGQKRWTAEYGVRSTEYGLRTGYKDAVLSPIALEKEGRKRKENGITTRGIRTWSFIQVLEPPNRA